MMERSELCQKVLSEILLDSLACWLEPETILDR